VISVSPDYFVDYYSRLPRPGIAALYRADGAIWRAIRSRRRNSSACRQMGRS